MSYSKVLNKSRALATLFQQPRVSSDRFDHRFVASNRASSVLFRLRRSDKRAIFIGRLRPTGCLCCRPTRGLRRPIFVGIWRRRRVSRLCGTTAVTGRPKSRQPPSAKRQMQPITLYPKRPRCPSKKPSHRLKKCWYVVLAQHKRSTVVALVVITVVLVILF